MPTQEQSSQFVKKSQESVSMATRSELLLRKLNVFSTKGSKICNGRDDLNLLHQKQYSKSWKFHITGVSVKNF